METAPNRAPPVEGRGCDRAAGLARPARLTDPPERLAAQNLAPGAAVRSI